MVKPSTILNLLKRQATSSPLPLELGACGVCASPTLDVQSNAVNPADAPPVSAHPPSSPPPTKKAEKPKKKKLFYKITAMTPSGAFVLDHWDEDLNGGLPTNNAPFFLICDMKTDHPPFELSCCDVTNGTWCAACSVIGSEGERMIDSNLKRLGLSSHFRPQKTSEGLVGVGGKLLKWDNCLLRQGGLLAGFCRSSHQRFTTVYFEFDGNHHFGPYMVVVIW